MIHRLRAMRDIYVFQANTGYLSDVIIYFQRIGPSADIEFWKEMEFIAE